MSRYRFRQLLRSIGIIAIALLGFVKGSPAPVWLASIFLVIGIALFIAQLCGTDN